MIIIFFSESFNNISLASVDFFVLSSIGSFVFAIYKYFKLNDLLKILKFKKLYMYKHFFKLEQNISVAHVAPKCIRFQSLFVANNTQERRTV